MAEILRKIYTFLFLKHDIGFCRFSYAMLIPCAFSETIRDIWMWLMIFTMALVVQANAKGWNRGGDNG